MDYPPWLKQSLRAASKKSGSQTNASTSACEKVGDPVTTSNQEAVTSNGVSPKALRDRRDTALSCLSEFEQSLIKMRFGFDGEPMKSDADIAKLLGKSEREVRDLADGVLRKLRWPTQH